MSANDSTQSAPTATNLSGRWSHSSYLLDPGAETKAEIWASGSHDWVETPQAGHLDTLQGTLTFPSGVTLEVARQARSGPLRGYGRYRPAR